MLLLTAIGVRAGERQPILFNTILGSFGAMIILGLLRVQVCI